MRMYGAVCGSIYPCNDAVPVPAGDAPARKPRKRVQPAAQGDAANCRKKVVVLDTGEVYGSIRAAAKALGVSKTALARAVSSGGTCCGFRVVRCQEESE